MYNKIKFENQINQKIKPRRGSQMKNIKIFLMFLVFIFVFVPGVQANQKQIFWNNNDDWKIILFLLSPFIILFVSIPFLMLESYIKKMRQRTRFRKMELN
jgi:hypothetical protein